MYAILALCLVAFAAAQQPVPCVTPPQWEANFFELNEQQRTMVRGRLTYDSVYHRERVVEEVDVGPQVTRNEILALFDSQIQYTFDFRTRTCTRAPITRAWRNFGIRPNATSFGEAYVGSSALPSAGILVTIWYVFSFGFCYTISISIS
jgi:hypothetical protein